MADAPLSSASTAPPAPSGEPAVLKPTFTRREFIRVAGLATAGVALGACNVTPATPTPRGGNKVQLVYQDWGTDWFPPMAKAMLDEFHASHPNIRVFYTLDPPSETFGEKMLLDFQMGTSADVFQGCCAFFPIWAQKQYALDLRPYVQASLDRATIEDWDPIQYRSFFAPDGRQYGLPKYHGALALYYNRDLFDRYKVTYPDESWTHEDYTAAMKQLTRDRNGDGKTDLWGSMMDLSWDRIQVHVNGFGGHFVDPNDSTRSLMAEPPALQAVDWIRARIWQDHVMAAPMDVQNLGTSEAFIAERVAMIEDGSWALKAILSEAKFRVGVAPFPRGPARRATLATTDGFGIFAGTKHPDAAWELLQFLISKDYGRAMARTHLLQPARASLVDEWVGFVRQELFQQARDLDIAAFADGHRKGYSVVAETFANMADAERIAYAAWQRVLSLGEGSLDDIRSASQQIDQTRSKPR